MGQPGAGAGGQLGTQGLEEKANMSKVYTLHSEDKKIIVKPQLYLEKCLVHQIEPTFNLCSKLVHIATSNSWSHLLAYNRFSYNRKSKSRVEALPFRDKNAFIICQA